MNDFRAITKTLYNGCLISIIMHFKIRHELTLGHPKMSHSYKKTYNLLVGYVHIMVKHAYIKVMTVQYDTKFEI